MNWLAGFSIAVLLSGCPINKPPMYERDARAYLQSQNIEAELISKLTRHDVLTAAEVARLQDFDNIAVKHLLGTNLGTPTALLTTLAKHSNFEVRTGVASNPKAPLAVLLSLRVPGRYDTVNLVLSGNPMLPQKVLREMYGTGEAGVLGLASNPNLPEDMMRTIDKKGDALARLTLARNPKLPRDLLEKYLADEMLRNNARANPQVDLRFRRPQDEMLGGP